MKSEALQIFIKPRLNAPFVWGKSDCALFLADWVFQYTGTDFAAPYRSRYKTEIGSKRALKKQGHADLTSVITAALGEPLATPFMAQRGDAVLVEADYGETCGIVAANGVLVQGIERVKLMPLSEAITAWRVESCHQ